VADSVLVEEVENFIGGDPFVIVAIDSAESRVGLEVVDGS